MVPRSLGIALRWAAAADGCDFGNTGAVIPESASVDVEASATFVLGLSVAAVFGTGATGWWTGIVAGTGDFRPASHGGRGNFVHGRPSIVFPHSRGAYSQQLPLGLHSYLQPCCPLKPISLQWLQQKI